MTESTNAIDYLEFDDEFADDFVIVLNRQKIREHLIEHAHFDKHSIKEWMQSKQAMDAKTGCRIRALRHHHKLVGWCGIQLAEDQYEIAIVLDPSVWGIGLKVFNEVMKWAKEFGHKEVIIHLLHTRREYAHLKKIAKKVYYTELSGNQFTTYQLAVI